jgi:anthranilate synthase/aminodeoxychorismate synthase-like glutamine amidotransferase
VKVLLVDHEDSFVYNLYQAFRSGGADVDCVRYTVPFATVRKSDPDAVVLSPGPGHPSDLQVTGLARKLITEYAGRLPILGVCLGHQLIGEYYGGSVVHAREPVHGEVEEIQHSPDALFRGVPSPFVGTRYHSLVVDGRRLPPSLKLTAWNAERVVMGLRHAREPTMGVQFHPESYLTRSGPRLLSNFLREVRS